MWKEVLEMEYASIKKELNKYYLDVAPKSAKKLQKECFALLDEAAKEISDADNFTLKSMQYKCIADKIEPVIFPKLPFYFEMGSMHPFCDGHYLRGMLHANGWLIQKNEHIFREENPHMNKVRIANTGEKLYLGDEMYFDLEHFSIPLKKIFKGGLRGVWEEAKQTLQRCETEAERKFVLTAIDGIEAVKSLSEKFSKKAEELALTVTDENEKKNLELIKETAARIPWEAQKSVYEGLATIAFMRKAVGSLEGVGYNTMGRVDVLLYPLYEEDKKKGISDDEIYDLVCKFLLIWDGHIDKVKEMSGYADYEYENALTLGGCDKDGNEVFNEITKFFLKAHYELDNTYPKIMCRYSAKSSKEYIGMITEPILNKKSVLLYCNDDKVMPAMKKQGFSDEHIYDYTVSGCWDIGIDDYCHGQCGQYINVLRALEWSMYFPKDKIENCELSLKPLENASSFEEVYEIFMHNLMQIIYKKAEQEAFGTRNWSRISPLCLTSALTYGPFEKRRDHTDGGSTYNWEAMLLAAVPDAIDSLIAIKTLCYDKKVCTLKELIECCRNNWDNEVLRQMAISAPSYGDGSEEASRLIAKFVDDVYNKTRNLPTAYGGSWQIGSYMYTEIIWWGKEIAATPNGRRNGELISQGFTPSRLKKIDSVTDVFTSLRYLDSEKLSGGVVINVVLPATNMTGDIIESFLRGCARSNTYIMQINCVDKEDLLKAQKNPENYGHIIVRVCGFSAQFISLSKEYQDEFLSRNFYIN